MRTRKIDIGIARLMRARGATLYEIADRFGVSHQAVRHSLSYGADPAYRERIRRKVRDWHRAKKGSPTRVYHCSVCDSTDHNAAHHRGTA